jgi:hypothetical protein
MTTLLVMGGVVAIFVFTGFMVRRDDFKKEDSP